MQDDTQHPEKEPEHRGSASPKKTPATPPKPFVPRKDKPRANHKPPKARIQRHQGR